MKNVKMHMESSRSVFRTLMCFLLLLVLFGCKVNLYSNLSEEEVNEMMNLLLNHGIECEKVPGQEQKWTLVVNDSDTAVALDVLRAYGYPRPRFQNMGEIFKPKGMVSSPMEERVRFIYALSQELSKTISNIDGVIVARVHIVLPENDPFTEKTIPSAAAVFIKYRPGFPMKMYIPQIRALVANSVEGLSFDRVEVVLVEAQPPAELGKGNSVSLALKESKQRMILVSVFCGLIGILLGGLGAWLFVGRRKRKAGQGEKSEGSGGQ